MNRQDAQRVIERAEAVLQCVRNQNSGADVHEIGNIRNVALMLVEELAEDPDGFPDDQAREIIASVERRLVNFYKRKYHCVCK